MGSDGALGYLFVEAAGGGVARTYFCTTLFRRNGGHHFTSSPYRYLLSQQAGKLKLDLPFECIKLTLLFMSRLFNLTATTQTTAYYVTHKMCSLKCSLRLNIRLVLD